MNAAGVRRWALRGLAGTVVVLAAGWFLYQRQVGPLVPVWPVTRADIVQTVVATGRIITPARLEIGPAITGTVASVLVRDGQSVRAGEVLFTLDDAEARAALAQARAGTAQARARLAQLEAVGAPVAELARRQAEANLALAERDMQRSRELLAQGFISQARFDEVARALEVARLQHDTAATQAQAALPAGAEFQLARTALDAAEAAERVARARLNHTVVRTPAAGVVVRRALEAGSVVLAGRAAIEIARAGETQIVAQIDERNLGLLRPGQPARGVADAYPGERFEAELFFINPGIDAQRGTVEVKLRVADPPAFVLPDMTVSIEIRVAELRSALTLPLSAVNDLATTPWVLKAEAGRAVKQPIRIGARGAERVQILDGMGEGEQAIAPAAGIEPSSPVRVQPRARR